MATLTSLKVHLFKNYLNLFSLFILKIILQTVIIIALCRLPFSQCQNLQLQFRNCQWLQNTESNSMQFWLMHTVPPESRTIKCLKRQFNILWLQLKMGQIVNPRHISFSFAIAVIFNYSTVILKVRIVADLQTKSN